MSFSFPVPAPYDAASYVAHESYDLTSLEPSDWKLTIGFECAEEIPLNAVCAGTLSAVPPREIPGDALPLLDNPAAAPTTITLYLAPSATPETLAINNELRAAGLGDEIRCFVYKNVDPRQFPDTVLRLIRANPKVRNLTNASRLDAFAHGEIPITVALDAALGQAYFRVGNGGNRRLRFGVLTSTGMIDPITFYSLMSARLTPSATAHLADFMSLIGTDWPFLGNATTATAAAVTASAAVRLYPAPALYYAKACVPLTAADWRAVGNGQKALYKTRLRNRAQAPVVAPAFAYSRNDMANPFQLEAVAEFFMGWPEPGTTALPAANAANLPVVDLQQGVWNLVIIDPFDHARLGTPDLPRPAYWLAGHSLSTQNPQLPDDPFGPCSAGVGGAADPPGPNYNPDRFAAVLFLVHRGQVKDYYRWSTYSSHRFEDRALGHCTDCYTASIKGNVLHSFESAAASPETYTVKKPCAASGSAFINYAFWLWDPSVIPAASRRTGARHYFRAGTPVKATGKDGIMLHHGQSAHTGYATRAYNGSGGCLVSPSFNEFRKRMVELYQVDYRVEHGGADDPALAPFANTQHAACVRIYCGTQLPNGVRYRAEQWNGKFSGSCWVIRPDEPAQK